MDDIIRRLRMKIGVPLEIKNHEHRVAMLPDGVADLVQAGHDVVVQTGAGYDSGFPDDLYRRAGATVVIDAAAAWDAELVIKVKEPQLQEYGCLRDGMTLFTYLHLAADRQLVEALLQKDICAIAYETVQLDDGSLPLLAPMSRVAGRVAVQLGARFLQQENGTPFAGKGVLTGCIEGGTPAHAVILGAGNVGLNAADALAGLGVAVTLMDSNADYLRRLAATQRKGITLQHYSERNMHALLGDCDLLIGAALVPGEHAPRLLDRADLQRMELGSVLIDVAIDQGGIAETSRATSYDEPVYVEEGVLHCALPNLPGAVPRTSTVALTRATLPYVLRLAAGVQPACQRDESLARGVNIEGHRIVHPGLAASLAHE